MDVILYTKIAHIYIVFTHWQSDHRFRSASLPRNFHKVNFGVGIFGKSHSEDKDGKTPAGSVNLLDDTLLESPISVAGAKMSQSLPY
ncbi:jg26408, partial [Pararge aegeria aegeria]